MSTLIIVEHQHNKITPGTCATISAALALQQPITAIVCGSHCEQVAQDLACYTGINQVILADNSAYEYQLPENLTPLLLPLAQKFRYVLAPASTFGKNLLPRLAALLDVSQISDVIEIIDPVTFKRPIYAGNALATVRSHDAITALTIRPTAFAKATVGQSPAPIEKLATVITTTQVQFGGYDFTTSERPELTSARVIVSGGRGMQDAAQFKLIEQLADCLQAAVGASRAAVDAGFAPNDYQVGQTGKVVAPELYIAVGISGAIQHIAGMKDSKVIVAINQDADAPIFQVADFGLVADLFKALPELIACLKPA